METLKSLAEAFPVEQARLRRIQGYCKDTGFAGEYFWFVLEEILVRADKAVMEQDTVAMVQIYQEMKDIQE